MPGNESPLASKGLKVAEVAEHAVRVLNPENGNACGVEVAAE